MQDYEIPIEIGSACRENHKFLIRDDIGKDNISCKDLLYCELTALYWIWKNNTSPYVGLTHYRRIIIDTQKEILAYLKSNDVCVKYQKLRLPYKDFYSCDENLEYHVKEDWDIMEEEIRRFYPDYVDSMNELSISCKVPSTCNIFIARKEIFDSYCAWLFPLLEAIEKRLDLSNRNWYQKRAIGYLSEFLLSLYIVHNNYRVKYLRVLYLTPEIPSFVPYFIKNYLNMHFKSFYYLRKVVWNLSRIYVPLKQNLLKIRK